MPRGAEPRTTVRSGLRRALALTLAVVVGAIAVAVVPAESASAVVVQWGTSGGTAPNYQTTVNGDFITVGNGVLACSGTALTTGAGSCLNLHAASDTNTANLNDNFTMVNSNTVAGFTTNSSTATMTIPSGATVTKAFLNWSAPTGTFAGDTRTLCTTYSAARGTATLPSGSATGYQTRAVQFQVGGGAITSFAPDTLLEDPTTQATTRDYTGAADVTSAFSGVTTGSAINISAGNIWAPTGAGCYAGWALTLIYDYGTYILGNNNSVPHRVIYYAGQVRLGQTDTPLSVDFTGFTAVATGTRASFSLYEGDRNITGDTASYSRAGSTTFTEIPNNAGATGNVGIGRADGSVRYTQTTDTSTFTNQSVDVDSEALTNVVAGDSAVTLKIGTSGDSYLLSSAVLSVPTAGIQVNKSYNGVADVQYRTNTEKATFTITLTNTGAGTLQNIQVTDDQADCTRALTGVTLLPLASTTITCTATNVTTASYTSTAQATATTVVGGYLASGNDSTRVILSALSLTKTSALAAGATGKAGDVLTYTFVATNTGGGPLTGVAITDPLSGLSALTYTWPTPLTPGVLAAGQSVTATATYTLKQTDVDAGSISNTATTTGTDADGGVKPVATATRTTPITSAPALSITKTGALAAGGTGKVGDTVNYSFSSTNTGNVTLTGVAFVDPHAGLSALTYTWPTATAGTLAPGQTVTATATYVLRQSDVDAGSAKNTATVSGTPPTGAAITTTSAQVSVPTVAAAPSIATTKSGAYTTGSGAVGSVITYSFSAKNTGNVTLTGVAITDPHTGLSALTYTWPTATAGTLAPGQTVTATATYTVKQSDIDAGTITNTATGTGTPPTGAAVTNAASVTMAPAAAAPAITLTKSGTASGVTVGSAVSYSFTLTNSGNVTLTGAGITDPLSGLSAITFGTWPSGTAGTLAPGQSVTATATYTLKQSDVDAGAVSNSATATAKPPTGANVTQVKSATVPIPATGSITTTKTGTYTSGSGAVGSVIRWDITFKNTGNVTLSQVALGDSLSGLSTPVISWPATAGTLAPGATATATATYTVTQADVDAGSVKNTATVTGKTPQGATVTGASPQASVTTATAAPGLSVVKSGAIAGGAAGNAGDIITYTFTLKNTGNVTLTGVSASDPLSGLGALSYSWPTATAGTLAPGQTATATASYTIKQSDVDTGNVKNTASASGTTPAGGTTTATSGQITTNTAAAAPAIVTTKSGTLANGATGSAGEVVTWTVTLRNSGNVTLTTVAAADSQAGISGLTYTWPGTAGTLAPGQTATGTATYTLTQTDVDAGAVSNVATGSGKSPTNVVVSSTASATVNVTSRGSLSLTKTPSVTSGAKAGDVITYTFVARNTGNVTLTGVTVSDPLAGLGTPSYGAWPSGTTGKLAPNQQVTATATYTVKQTDVDAGFVKNTASVTGNPPTGLAATASSGQVTVTTVAPAPAVTTTKTAAYTTGSGAVGSVITYSFSAKNTGNVTLTGVSIADPHTGLSTLTYTWPGTAGTLAPNQTVTATATYTVKQSDVDAGTVTNTATSTGTPPTGAPVTSPASASIATAVAAPAVTLTKSGSAAGTAAGSTVTYTFVLKNTGNVTLTGAGITDPLPGLSAISIASWPSGTVGKLNVGDQVTGTATYTLTQADVDAGSVANTSTATATPPTGAAVTRTASATVPVAATGSLNVTKSGAYSSGTGAVGSVITWSITFKNTGNVTLSSVALSDSLSGLSTPTITWPGTAGTLAPNQTATATATYTVTQADVNLGSVKNTATATGNTPKGVAVTGSSPQASVATVAAAPGLSLVKSGVVAGGAAGNAGDVITYTFTLKNTGNVTLTGVTASDPLAGLSALSYTWPGTAGALQPNQTATATASYTIKQSDVDTGNVKNTATASGTTPTGGTTGASSGQITTNTAAAAPATATTKSGVLAAGSTGAAGDTVNWSFSVKNTGNVTLTSVAIADSLAGISALTYTWPGTPGTLAPNQTATATATYLLTQTDVDAGAVSNVATGSGASPANVTASSTAPATVTVTPRSSVSVTKSPSVTSGAKAGDVITYTFVASNTGNTTLSGVTVSDPLAGLGTITYVSWPEAGVVGKLAPGHQVTATATYTVKQTDVDAGFVKNTASVTANPPTGAAVTGTSGQVTVTTVAAAPAIATTKSAAYTTGSGAVGSVITYSFSAKNTGNVTLTSVGITDPHAGLSTLTYTWPGAAGALAPGQTVTATATYAVRQSDVDAGTITNTATGTGTPPTGAAVTSPASATIAPAAAAPSVSLTKSGSAAGATAGSTVTYTFVLKNTGNVTLTGAGISDPLSGLSGISIPNAGWPSGVVGKLNVGDQVTGTATYTLKQSDVDAGSVANTSTVSATPPTGTAVTATASATVPIAPTGALTLTKSGAYTTGSGAVGSVITWTIAVKNTGNVTLTQVTLSDTLSGLSTPTITWPAAAGTLAPNQTATATATYTVTQADVDAGSIKNTASSTARTPKNVAVTGTSPEATVTTSSPVPGLSLVKAGVIAGGAAGNAGDVITYTFTLKNTGNVTLTGVAASDPLAGLSALTYSWPGAAGTLAPNQTATATASYTIKQSDVDLGNVKNTATASGTTPTGGTTPASSGQVTTNTAAFAPATTTTKSGALAAGSTGAAGDTVNWTISVKNTGNVTLTSVAIADSLAGITAPNYTWPGTAGTLAPGQTATATATSPLSQTDVDAGAVTNTATGSGRSPTNVAASSTAPATVTVTPRSSLSLTKTPSVTSGAKAGDVITYTFVARNTGNVSLSNVTITDPLSGLSAISPATTAKLAPGQQVTATATYTVTQTDVDAGFVKNTAGVTGTPPTGSAATASSGQVTVTTVAPSPAIVTTKSGAYSSGTGAVGSVITYSFSAKNTGNVTLTGVAITDPLTGLTGFAYGTWPSGGTGKLLPGQTVTASATYTVIQSDVDRGAVNNTATSTGTPPTGAAVSNPASASTATAASAPAVTLTKSGVASGSTAGSTVTYTFVLKNTGNVTLTGADISDPLSGLSAITVASWPSGTAGRLNVGDQVTGTATYTLKQSDVDAGSVVNTATATATPPSGAAVTRTASATVPIASAGAMTLAKTSAYTSGTGAVGSVITYTFTAKNTGNVTLTSVAVADPLSGLGTISYGAWPSGTTGTLRVGDQVVGTATYTVTQADVNRGNVVNTASVSGRNPTGGTVTASSPTVTRTTAAAVPAITTAKSASVSGTRSVGDTITYTITATNAGNVTLTGVTVSDPMFTQAQLSYGVWPSGTTGTLQPGQSISATGTRTISQTDVDAGSVVNTASSSGTPPTGAAVSSSSPTVTTTLVTRAPTISLTQTGALPSGSTGRVGDTVTWTYTIKNTGNVTLTTVGVAPGLAGVTTPVYGTWPSGTAGTLAPGQSVTATATSTLTQAQVDAGSVTDPAVASGTGAGTTVTKSTPATVTFTPTSSLSITKSGSYSTTPLPRGSIAYTFVVKNTGATTLTGTTVSDPHPGLGTISYGAWPSGTTGTLLPGDQVTATANYPVPQADLDAGSSKNTATANATNPTGGAVTASSGQVTTPLPGLSPSIAVSKSAVPGSGAVGSTTTYNFTVTNTGGVTLHGITLTDPLLTNITFDAFPAVTGTLAPTQSVTAHGSYVLVQADVDRGYVDNTATTTGLSPLNAQVSGTSALVHTPTAAANPKLTLSKTGVITSGGGKTGSVLTFTFTVTNTGNVTLTGTGIADQLSGIGAVAFGAFPSGTTGKLRPGDVVTGTATYTATQSDVDAGSVVNTATANGAPPTGSAATSAPASATVNLASTSSMTLTKSASVSGTKGVGSTVTYSFVATNTGNVTLKNVTVSDPLSNLGTIGYGTWTSGTAGTLLPGGSVTATATYTVTQADVDKGSIDNQATLKAALANGTAVTPVTSNALNTPLVARTSTFSVVKNASITSGAKVGDVIHYTVTATNTGNTTMTGVTVTDPLSGLTGYAVAFPGATGVLSPGAAATGTGNYQVTQADVDAGSIVNTATASGNSPLGATGPTSGSVTTNTQTRAPAITVADSGALAAGSTGKAGDTVTFSYVVTNTGNTTLTAVAVTETLSTTAAPTFGGSTTVTLAPGQSATATASHILTQAEVDAGSVTSNVATHGTPPTGADVTATGSATVPIASAPNYTVVKSAAFRNGGTGAVGDTIRYTLTVTNTGNVTLYRAQLVDPLPGLGPQNPTWPDPSKPGQVGVGQTATGFADYVITQADVNLGHVDNTAHVAFFTTPTTGGTEVDRDSNAVRVNTVQATPRLTTTKSGTASGSGGVGSTISWTVIVTNSGNVTVTGIAIAEQLTLTSPSTVWQGGVTGTLAPGATATLTGTTAITQTDVDAGSVANTASASGTSSRDGAAVSSNTASATVRTQTSAAAIHVTKSAAPAAGFTGKAGDLVTFSYTLTNTGNVSLSAVSLSESLPTTGAIAYTWPAGNPPGTLAVGATVTATVQHRLTQAEVDAGSINSPVTGVGTPPAGASPVSDTASAGITITSSPSMAVTKQGVTGGTGAVGDHIAYRFTITNTGNVTLSLVDLIDSLAGVSTPTVAWPDASKPGVVGPGQVANATSDYVITQADVDSGSVKNTATASGKPPVGDTIFASSPLTTTTVAPEAPALTVTKTSNPTAGLRAGDVITYTITGKNTGNVTIGGITASDPLTGIGALAPQWPGTAGTLTPGQSVVYTASYRVTQADIDAGSVVNSATVSGTTGKGTAVSGTGSVTTNAAAAARSISITDSGALAQGSTGKAGDTVIWSYLITNTGSVTLTGVTATETQTGATAPVFGTWPGSTGTLAPGQSVTATSSYVLTQADLDAHAVSSAVSTRGDTPTPGSTVVTANATATLPLVSRPDYTVVKSAALLNGGSGAVGDTVRYTLNVTNTGNVTLYRAQLNDPLPGLGPQHPTWPDASKPGQVAPGQVATGYADYVITQADVNLGRVDNTAHVAFFTTPTTGGTEIDRDSNAVRVTTASAVPALTVTKSGTASGTAGVGSTISWTVVVTNSGNVTVSAIAITEQLTLTNPATVWQGGVAGTLAPGATATLTGTTTITQTDVDAGAVANTASASGKSARDNATVASNTASATVRTQNSAAAVHVTKTAAPAAGFTGKAGDLVTFSYTLTNTGNVSLSGVSLSESLSTVTPGITYTWPAGNPPGTLAVGATLTATAQHRLTQAEVDAGGINSPVTGVGTPPAGAAPVSDTASAGVTVASAPSMIVTKQGATSGTGGVGTHITYSFTITNTGNVTLSLVDLIDSLAGVSAPAVTWPDPAKPGVLAPGGIARATSDYTVTQADVDAGTVKNTATASGKPPVGDTIFASSPLTSTTVQAQAPALTVTKAANPTAGLHVGDVIQYAITATNTGNVTVSTVTVTDTLAGIGALTPTWSGTAGSLAPGQNVDYATSYVVKQSDIDAGSVVNSATVSGKTAQNTAVSGTGTVTSTAATTAAQISITDSGALAAGATGVAGDRVNWSYVITNTGGVTLTGVTAAEGLTGATIPVFGTWPGPVGTLAPGQSVTAGSSYVLTQSDVDAGSVASAASTAGTTPSPATTVTGSATATVPLTARPDYTVVKSAALLNGGTGAVGDTVRYTLNVTNTGNVTLYRAQLNDPLPGLGPQHPTWPDASKPGQVAPGQVATGYADYVITQADVNLGRVDNTAHVAFFTTPTTGGTEIDRDSNAVRVTTVQATPRLVVTKSGVASGTARVGDTITWTVRVTNTGNVTVTGISISDDLALQGISTTFGGGVAGTLAPAAVATLTGTTTITQTDVDAGSVANTAHSSGVSARDGSAVVGNDAPATVRTIGAAPSIDVTKSATRGSGWTNTAGDLVAFAYTVTNTGNTTLTGVTLAEALPTVGGLSYTWPDPANPGRLLPGQTATATAGYAITQADVDRGSESSAVTATGTPASGGAPVTDTDTAGVAIDAAPKMAVTKAGVVAAGGGVGDHIDYSFTITNTGNVTLTLVDLLDSLAGVSAPVIVWPHPAQAGVLAPGEQATATARYTITQADVDAGTVANVATASGKPPVGDKITQVSNTSNTTVAAQAPALTVTKTASPTSGARLGTVVNYSIRVVNSGNVTLTGVTVTDALPGLTGFTVVWPGTPGTLTAGQAATATPSYRVTQADVDAGHIDNSVAASGTSPKNATVNGQATATTQVVTPASPTITVGDSGALAAGATGVAGDVVTWTYTITNAGDVTLHGITAAESQTGASTPAFTWPGATGVLAPGQSATGTATYTLTQSDVDAHSVASHIAVTGLSPTSVSVNAAADATVPIASRPSFTVVKGGGYLNGAAGVVGDTIRYTLSGVNTGNVTLYRGNLIDPLPGLGDQHITWPDPAKPGIHPPGTTVSGYADYVLTQADVDRGYIDNVATIAEYTTPTGNATDNRVVVASNQVHITTTQAAPHLSIVKTSTTSGSAATGDTVSYTVVTRNDGNVTITGIAVRDPLLGTGPMATTWPGTTGVLAPGQQATSTGSYTITQADVDRGGVVNTATASGSSARDGAAVSGTSNQLTTPTATRAPSITVSDAGALATPSDAKAGGTVVWRYRITNTGNVTLTGTALSDSLVGIGAPSYTWPAAPGTLAPGAFVDVTANYTLTQADVDAGSVISMVAAHGTPPSGADATATNTATVLVSPAPAFSVTKTGSLLTAGRNGVGDTVVFSFVLRNSGNVTLSGVTLTDSLAGLGTPTISWPTATAGVLPPGSVANATARYQLSQADVDAGSVSNQASATATPPTGPTIPAQSGVATVAAAAPVRALSVVKSGALTSGSGDAGSVVRFGFVIKNTGNVTVSGVTLTDNLSGLGTPVLTFPGGATTLIPGASATGFADYALTQADVDRGYVDNSATVNGTAPGNVAVNAASNALRFSTAPGRPSILTTQSGALAGGQTGQVGDTIAYTLGATNTGNVTLTGVTLSNTVAGLTNLVYTWPGTPGVLAPGQSVVLHADHVVTQADENASVVRNIESSVGTPPSGAVVRNTADELVIPLATTTGLTLTKSGSIAAPATGAVGDTVTYSFDLTNTGSQSVTAAAIDDGLPGISSISYGAWPSGTTGRLDGGQAVHATASYVVTQADVDRGRITNTATASALSPTSTRIATSSAPAVVTTAAAAPGIQIVKTGSLSGTGAPKAGDVVTYRYTVSNPGNVTLNVVGVGDSQPGATALQTTWPGTPGVLAPGQSATATATYTLTQADIDAGSITSTGSAQGTGARGGAVTAAMPLTITLASSPSITIDKTASPQGTPTLGSTVLYSFVVTNTGNVTLNAVSVGDSLIPSADISYAWPGANGVLLPGQTVQATASYTVTQLDVDAGAVDNTATTQGTPPTGAPVGAQDSAVVAVPNGASILLTVTVEIAPGESGYAGDHLIYHYTLTNNGNRAVSDASITDSKPGLGTIVYGAWPGAVGVLLPGQSVTATATYLIGAADEGRVVTDDPTASATGASASQIVTSQAAVSIQLPTRAIVDPGGLVRTGVDPTLPVNAALLLVLLGLVLFGAARRRRKENA